MAHEYYIDQWLPCPALAASGGAGTMHARNEAAATK